ncbi:capsular polysaccharide biosynthesis protein-like protein [Neoasaia chiangmaiensis NBRC 101099]|uniref:glycosyltransferase family 61 protein n=1 Tax=Neoasaia chiangmaiensis TaxID=320497 RepID=UPI00098AF692|nr:glycosyltransferase 61 family protein [Neoasaia chiangmaiensis]GBR39231.1 capsular polysaccharide biosynthesis protein-like protein [Neoasaia chiangmaiensis NBRC 101099]GEN15510.1 hypothetical protein NCH01_19410 [Neoasaia chiangmaiensis]
MILRNIKTVWGKSHLVQSLPIMEDHFDVIFVPFAEKVHLDHDRHWGIFSKNGTLIDASAYCRGPDRRLVCDNGMTELKIDDIPYAPEDHYIYGGQVINHFGHFIITSLARLWCLEYTNITSPVIFHSHGPISNWFDIDYRMQLWNAVGINQSKLATFDRPVRIKHITIPRPSFEEQNYVHRVYGQMCRSIGDILVKGATVNNIDRPVYLSKHLMGGGVTKIGNENEIIDVFRRANVDIVAPETLSLSDQIKLFRERRVVIGTSSSAFHVSAFSGRENDIFCILPNDLLNSNFLLVDKIAKNNSRYFFPTTGTQQFENRNGFNSYSVIENPKMVAEEILSII